MALNRKDLLTLAKITASANPSAPTSYSFGEEKFSYADLNQEQIEEGWLGDKWNQAKSAYGTATQSNDRMGLKDRFQAAKKNWESQGQLNNINALIQQISQFVDSGEINPQMTIGQLIGGKYNKGRFGKMTSIANNQRNQIKRRGGEAY